MDIIMKKFIIVTVFVFLIALFVSFNYLLWDREKQLESFQDIRDSNNLTIDTLSEKMNNLDKLNKELNKTVETLTEDNDTIRENTSLLSNENMDLKREIVTKNNIIIQFKKTIDVASMEAVINKWVEVLNSKDYKGAHEFISKNSNEPTLYDLEKFKATYQSEIKAIRLKSLKLFTEYTDDEHLGKIQIKVVFEVDKPDITDENKDEIADKLFKSGDNEKYITMELDPGTNEWLILEILDKP